MNMFAEFARYYDLFYRDKDYAGEAAFARSLIEQHAPGTRTLLELGCGTGRHAMHWLRAGLSVTGVDRSEQMLDGARRTAESLPEADRARLKLVEADVSALGDSLGLHDAAVSLFHVVNYQTTDEALAGMFAGTRRALRPGGAFFFDYWYGPGVLSDRPVVRVREAHGDNGELVTRTATPQLDIDRNLVTVDYQLRVVPPQGEPKEFHELHRMRYLFLPEIEKLAANAGFSVAASGRWMEANQPLDDSSWFGWAVLRAE